jgi:hypothetical protein
MSHMGAPRPSLKLPGMLDEPTAFFQLLLQRQIRQPAARRRAGAFWEPNDGALTGSVMRQEPPSLKVKRGQVLHFAPQP